MPGGVSCWLQARKAIAHLWVFLCYPLSAWDVLPLTSVSPIRLTPPLDASFCPCPVPRLPFRQALRASGSCLHNPQQSALLKAVGRWAHSPASPCPKVHPPSASLLPLLSPHGGLQAGRMGKETEDQR